ncbi:MAG: ACT domain-containing protein [Sporichthyaceae bacterium]
MLLRLRISLPDRPGSLAKVSRVLGALGADIRGMTVLDHGGISAGGRGGQSRVVDEFTVFWPNYPGLERLTGAFAALPGVTVEGAWETRAQVDAFPDLDVLLQVMASTPNAFAILADALPGVFGADWAVVLGEHPERPVLAASPKAPALDVLPDIRPTRPLAFTSAPSVHIAAVPADATSTVYLGRTAGGPPFHRIELARLARLVEVAGTVLERRESGRELTGSGRQRP